MRSAGDTEVAIAVLAPAEQLAERVLETENQSAPSSPVFGIAGVLDVAWGWSFHGSLGAGPSAIHAWPYRTPLRVQLP